jgi:hypothetical protein
MRYLYSEEGYYDCKETDRAVEAYFRSGGVDQPCRSSSGHEGELIVLRNARGELARYRISARGKLRRLLVRDETSCYYDCPETDHAVEAYFRRAKRFGCPEDSIPVPNRDLTRRVGDEVVIANGPGVLAR